MSDSRTPDSPENPHAGQGSVMLDIGGDIGAVIVTMPESMVGQEVDIVAIDVDLHAEHEVDRGQDEGHDHGHDHDHGHGHGHGPGDRPHVAVVRRPLPSGGEVACLVYPEVVEGSYRLLMKGTNEVVMVVEVIGGQVTDAVWPG